MSVLGGIIGLILGGLFAIFGALTFGLLPGSSAVALFGPLAPFVAPVFATLQAITSLINLHISVAALLWYVFAILFTWLISELASTSYFGSASHTSSMLPAATRPTLTPPPVERLLLGIMIGFAVAINSIFWVLAGKHPHQFPIPGHASLSAVIALLALLPFLCVFMAVSTSRGFQSFIAWLGWLLPFSWLADIVGFIGFVIAGIVSAAAGTFAGLRFDPATSSFELSITGLGTAFSMGHFNLVSAANSSPFNMPGTSAHEAGHTLNTMLFGAPFLAVNGIMIPLNQPVPHNRVWGELLAEGHRPHTLPGLPFSPLWTP